MKGKVFEPRPEEFDQLYREVQGRGQTQRDLAAYYGVSAQTVAAYAKVRNADLSRAGLPLLPTFKRGRRPKSKS